MISTPGIIFKSADERLWAQTDTLSYKLNSKTGLLNLPPGIWFLNVLEAKTILYGDFDCHVLLAADWLGISIDEIAAEWGLNPAMGESQYRMMSWILNRILLLTCMLFKMQYGFRLTNKEWMEEFIPELTSSTSILQAINRQFFYRDHKQLRGYGLAPQVMEDLTLFGRFGTLTPKLENADLPVMTASFPRFYYLNKLARMHMPIEGKWRKINLDRSSVELTNARFRLLEKIKEPLILFGKFNLENNLILPWVNSWLSSPGKLGRTAFTFKEVKILRQYGTFLVESIFVGPGWQKLSPLGSNYLLSFDQLGSICGGVKYAKASWTAAIIAQFLFQGLAYNSLHRNKGNSYAWMAAEDRIQMLPIIDILHAKNYTVLSAAGGVIKFLGPKDIAGLNQLGNELATMGVALTYTQRHKLKEKGLDLDDGLKQFKGPRGSQKIQYLMHHGKGDWLWKYDSLIGLMACEKRICFNALNKSLENFHA